MYLGYQNNRIVLATETREELINSACIKFDRIEETDKTYFLHKGEYVTEIPTVPLEEQVAKLEQDYNMNRWQREGILAEGSLYSDYTKAKAQEIEDLAEQLRTGKESLQVEEVVIPETENTSL